MYAPSPSKTKVVLVPLPLLVLAQNSDDMPRTRTLENRRLKQVAEAKRVAADALLCPFCQESTKGCKEVIYGNPESQRLEDGDATHAIHFDCIRKKLITGNGIYCKQKHRSLELHMCLCQDETECDHYSVEPRYFFPNIIPSPPPPPPVPEPPRVSMSAIEMIGLGILCVVFWRLAVMVFVAGQ